jgi:RHS repeat-associated protein
MAQVGSDGNTIAWSYDSNGKMLGFTLNGVPYFYLRNLQGDVVGVYDANGVVRARYEYDAWGKIVDFWQDDGYNVGEANPIRYRGYYWDAETGYYYCQSRYYNPQWCRWISADVFMDTDDGIMGTNMYAYCLNDPVNMIDTSGCASDNISLGRGWWYRYDIGKVGNPDHVQVFKSGKKPSWPNATERYALSAKGGKVSHDGSWKGNGPPNWVKKQIKKEIEFDWDAARTDYLNNESNISYAYINGYSFDYRMYRSVPSMVEVFKDGSLRTYTDYDAHFRDLLGENIPIKPYPVYNNAASIPAHVFVTIPLVGPVPSLPLPSFHFGGNPIAIMRPILAMP